MKAITRYGLAALTALFLVSAPAFADDNAAVRKFVAIADATNGNAAQVDSLSNALVGITFAHHECHEGDCFVADFVDETLADNETIILAFKTEAGTKRVHMVAEFSTLVGGDLELWEGAAWTAQTGTEEEIINRKREVSMNSSGLLANQAQAGFVAADVMVANPTGLNTGSATSLHHFYAWGKKEQIQAGGQRDVEEFMLKPDTAHAAIFTADGASNKAQVILNFYEHTDSN